MSLTFVTLFFVLTIARTANSCYPPFRARQLVKPAVGKGSPGADICSLPVAVGHCRAFRTRYYFDAKTSTCRPFRYSGCGGNRNNFAKLYDCLKRCQPVSEERQCKHGPGFIDECDNDCNCLDDGTYGCTRKLCQVGQRPEQPKTCSGVEGLPKRAGQRVFCHDGIVKYQPEDAICVSGSAFMDPDGCNTCFCGDYGEASCTLMLCSGIPFIEMPDIALAPPPKPTTTASPYDCTSPPETGMCKAFFEMYAYHPKTGVCAKFVYGGCGGNGNRYRSLEECQQRCARRDEAQTESSDAEPTEPSTAPTTMAAAEFVCPKPLGIFRDPHDCHSFYVCSGGVPTHKKCSMNTRFNAALGVCDLPENVPDC